MFVDSQSGATPAFIAAQNGHSAVVEMLAKYGANLNTPKQVGAKRSELTELSTTDRLNTHTLTTRFLFYTTVSRHNLQTRVYSFRFYYYLV